MILSILLILLLNLSPIILEENDTVSIVSISDVEYYDDHKLVIVDRDGRQLLFYNDSGKLLFSEKPSYKLSELVVHYYKKNFSEDSLWITGKPVEVISFIDYKLLMNNDIEPTEFYKNINNEFGSVEKYDDENLLVATHVYFVGLEFLENKRIKKYYINQTVVFKYNIKEKLFKLFYINTDGLKSKYYNENFSFRHFNLLLDDNKNIIIHNHNELLTLDTINKRPPILLSKIIEGNNKTNYLELSNYYTKSGFNYTATDFRGEMRGNNLYSKYFLLPYIYKNDRIAFQLKPNDLFSLNPIMLEKQSKINLDLINKFEYTFSDISLNENFIFVLIKTNSTFTKESLKNKSIIQKYDFDGNLLGQIIYNTKEISIYKIKTQRDNLNSINIFYLEGENILMQEIEI
ncbi:hypothetical protein OAQ99_01040 [Candidatus Kapabacteria bacterium]|nr:hypothetical protein [Candidatus Kapabacteria bacterium]